MPTNIVIGENTLTNVNQMKKIMFVDRQCFDRKHQQHELLVPLI